MFYYTSINRVHSHHQEWIKIILGESIQLDYLTIIIRKRETPVLLSDGFTVIIIIIITTYYCI